MKDKAQGLPSGTVPSSHKTAAVADTIYDILGMTFKVRNWLSVGHSR